MASALVDVARSGVSVGPRGRPSDRGYDDTLGLEVGRHLGDAYALSGKPSIQVYGSEDFAWALELSLTFRFN